MKKNTYEKSTRITFELILEQHSDTNNEFESNDKYIPVLFKLDSRIHFVAIPIELENKFPKFSLWNIVEKN